MANVSPKRWTETFQMRVAPEFLESLDAIAAARGLSRSEAARAVIEEEKERLDKKSKRAR